MDAQDQLRRLPSVRELLDHSELRELRKRYSHALVVSAIQETQDKVRTAIREGISEADFQGYLDSLPSSVAQWIEQSLTPSLRHVVNATGIVVYTNAGRAPMAASVLAGLGDIGRRYTNLEYDLNSGKRGHRDQHLEKRLCRLLGVEAATACNNAAAAVLLILNTLADGGRQVVVSRGELIEIGGSFRIPAILEKSGASLREVGTTNKTRASDYADAIGPDTALILRVHPSNYQIVGFTHRPRLEELVEVARKAGVPLAHDLGSGYLFRTDHPFLAREPTAEESVRAGSDLVCFSGDKLLGGPQAGLIVGRRRPIDEIRRNPLMRACRLDKLTYAALERTLMEYQNESFQESLPVWQLLSAGSGEIRQRSSRLKSRLESVPGCELGLTEGFSLTGGGSAPEEQIPTTLIHIRIKGLTPNALEKRLRSARVPILSRIVEDRVTLDLRTVFPEEEGLIAEAIEVVTSGPSIPHD